MEFLDSVVGEMRRAAGLSQRELARRAGTSQPAVARYERGSMAPSWQTLERLAAACGRHLRIEVEVLPDPGDVELAELLLNLTPLQRLRSLRRYARLHSLGRLE